MPPSGTYCTIAGISVPCLEGFEDEPELQGAFERLDGNDAWQTQRSPKRRFGLVLRFNPPSSFDTFLAAISGAGGLGVATAVSVTSPADGLTRGATLQCFVWLGRATSKPWHKGTTQETTVLTCPATLREA